MQLYVLGPLEVVSDRTVVRVPSRQQRRVLTALSLAPGSVVSTDRLMFALWGDALPRSALNSLRTHVCRVRDALHDREGAIISTCANGYMLRIDRGEIDAYRFEQLVAHGRQARLVDPERAVTSLDAALAMWRGRAYADFADEPFVRPAAVRLEELRRSAIEDRFDALLASGRHVEVTAELGAFADRHPLRERPRAQLMLALYRDGRQAEALAVFRAFRTLLVDELGLQPSATLRSLEHDILLQDPRLEIPLRPATPHASAFPQLAARPSVDVPGRGRLLERDAQFAALEGLLTTVRRSRRGRLVIVHGEAGIGKTALVNRFCDQHRQNLRLLWGACCPLFTPRPLGPLRDVADAVGGALHDVVARTGTKPYDVATALFAELGVAAPTALVLEDLHWADEATLDVVRLLGRRVTELPALVLVTYRDDELDVDHPLRRVLGELVTLPATSQQPLEPLSTSAVCRLAAADGRDGVRIHAVTGGNPLFVAEVLASPGDDVPETILHAVLGRAGRLDHQARALLEAIAVAPPRVEPWLLSAMAGSAADRLDACLASGLVAADSSGIAFRHELARRAIESTIPPHRRTMLHQRALDALSSHPEDRHDLPRLVHHADAAGRVDDVLRIGRGAARQAAERSAHREAAAYYARVLRHGDRLEPLVHAAVLEQYAHACFRTDKGSEAIAAMEQAARLHRRLGDGRAEGNALRALSGFLWSPGRTVQAMASARRAVRLLEQQPASADLGMACNAVGRLALHSEDIARVLQWSGRARDIAETIGDVLIDVQARTNLATIAGLAGDSTARAQFDDCLRTADAAGLREEVSHVLLMRAVCALRRHDYDTAIYSLARAETLSRDLGHERTLFSVRAYQSVAALDVGDWCRAAEFADLVIRHPRTSTIPRILALTVSALIAGRTGSDDPLPALDEATELAAPTGELERLVPPALARAEIAWTRGRRAAVVEATDEVYRLALERRATWMVGPLSSWRLRAGVRTDLPDGVAEPYLLQASGRHRDAARWWSSRRCGYAAALSLLDADDVDSVEQAIRLLRGLGAGTLTRRHRHRAVGRVFAAQDR